ncbi:DUF554 domain-containing protein [Isobaculum melis]|uniref:DUF554 domain-containing protein n=1 Tax=Isobaculum melis TaxID=142588 RepID=A0A1H9SPE3_9LACT|nr:DUF554 domain-containing protein [Isobaculum melis]SER86764.1 hypothetical protein SAMN04488559_10870 [Isobaculum melis]
MLPVGPIVDCLGALLGAVLGSVIGHKIPSRIREGLPLTFGIISLGMGISMVMKVHSLPPIILSLLIGSVIGEGFRLEQLVEKIAFKVKRPIDKLFPNNQSSESDDVFMQKFVAVLIVFTVGPTGIFGALNEGITGDASMLISKGLLDFCTAAIFAAALGYIVCLTVIPQMIITFGLFFLAGVIMPLTTPEMIANFSACGGMMMMATGFRISGIKNFPITNLIPGLILVMPITALWMMIF